ncbi:hypoxanthine phosphoribosyltransferase [Magnetococcus marinus MC-1]|uniref:Hypoxanthine phosphoribosyltransferase n=1 Tax=Magnetococcus marinus (strain ATCC BAA-1437 / JCM 17883 / MC-1) TaxID=156889 RepID=A0LCI9_MAGMM|nr:hypoxanthine phosphoribosyltransferase [Magnetococcus marinus]ABK45682.1 hypoxanthine phosphoribosyltransferase [Magnetococcus marinus MC-1]
MASHPRDVTPAPLITEAKIQRRVQALAKEIIARMGQEPVMVALLKGSFLFAADLLREMGRQGAKPKLDFLAVSSYGSGTQSTGQVQVQLAIKEPLQGRDVLLVDDILDTGNTFAHVIELLKAQGAQQVLTCTLLNKQARRQQPVVADFIGFEVPDAFVVGYGIDWDNHFRELPYVGVIPPEAYR